MCRLSLTTYKTCPIFQECLQHYETALDYCKRELQNDEAYLSAITVTITYNLARLYEALHEFGKVPFLSLVRCSFPLIVKSEFSRSTDLKWSVLLLVRCSSLLIPLFYNQKAAYCCQMNSLIYLISKNN